MALRTTATRARPPARAKRPAGSMPSLELAKYANPLMVLLLRSPLHGVIGKELMLITFKGRRSGRRISTPVSYIYHDGTITLFTRGKWWKNLQGGAPVTMRVHGRDLHGNAESFTDIDDVVRGAFDYIRAKGVKNAWKIRMALDRHYWPSTDEMTAAAQGLVMVRVRVAATPETR